MSKIDPELKKKLLKRKLNQNLKNLQI